MGGNQIGLIYFCVILYIGLCLGELKTYIGGGSLLYNDANLWTPLGVPDGDDFAYISGSKICAIKSPVNVGNLTVGDATTNSILIVVSSIYIPTAYGNFIIANNSEALFNITSLSQTIDVYNMYIYGTTYNYNQFQAEADVYISDGSFVNSYGSNATFYYGLELKGKSLYVGGGLSTMFSLLLDGGGITLINSFLPNVIVNLEIKSGVIALSASYLFVMSPSIFPASQSEITLQEGSVWEWSYINNTDYGSFVYLNSLLNITDSNVTFSNIISFFGEGSYVNINKGIFVTDLDINFKGNSGVSALSSGIYTDGYFFMSDQSEFLLQNSNLVITGMFGMLNSSKILSSNSTIYLTLPDNTTDGALGLFDTTSVHLIEGSEVFIDGYFICSGDSYLDIWNSSLVYVLKEFAVMNDSAVILESDSELHVLGFMILSDTSYMRVTDSRIYVHAPVALLGESNIQIINSQIFINDSLIVNTTTNPSRLINSVIYANGEFIMNGILEMIDSFVLLESNMTSNYILYMNSSGISVVSGSCYFYQYSESRDSLFNIETGVFVITDNSTFICHNCSIVIQKGSFIQGINASINITNTVITNNAGTVDANSDIILRDSSISNSGSFNLKADILPYDDSELDLLRDSINNPSKLRDSQSSYRISNSGNFIVNGNKASKIDVIFDNEGTLSIQQDTNIFSYQQSNGSLSLSDKSISSDNKIQISGGNIEGSGTINTPSIENNNGTLGGQNIDSLIINGSYTQSKEGTLQVNFNENEEMTQIDITNQVILDGTLIIRIEESKSDIQTTKQILTYSNSQGNFNTVIVKTYNKETGTETIQPDCKASTSKSEKGLSVLLNPDPDSCNPKKKVNKGLIIGLTIGLVGAAAIITTAIIFRNKIPTKILLHKIKMGTIRSK